MAVCSAKMGSDMQPQEDKNLNRVGLYVNCFIINVASCTLYFKILEMDKRICFIKFISMILNL